jgi:tetratricopeptide (TPR) repeat protein
MSRLPALCLAAACLWGGVAAVARAEAYVWVDDAGVTHLTDDPSQVPEADRYRTEIDALRSLWGDEIEGPVPLTPPGSSSRDDDRIVRLLDGAVDDLRRGETARATAALESVLRLDPNRAEAQWYLALLDRRRGRYDRAEERLRAFLSTAGDDLATWRASAERRLAALRDERRLADPSIARGPLQTVSLDAPGFRARVDAELVRPEYARTVIDYLGEARATVSARLGVVPLEPMGVVFYGKAAYAEAYQRRFSFQTVGFFDGRIHVTSAAHPGGELRGLLFHEYVHAVFREQTGGDRPYWLNEGLAESIERSSSGQPGTSRSERAFLRRRLEGGDWLALARLAPSFSGLDDEDARAAYLESVLAVAWLDARTDPARRARLLRRLGEGAAVDDALREAVGAGTDGVDQGIRDELAAEFPAVPRLEAGEGGRATGGAGPAHVHLPTP